MVIRITVFFVIVIALLARYPTLLAELPDGSHFEKRAALALESSVVGAGGTPATSGIHRLNGTLGQTAIGFSSTARAWHHAGFWGNSRSSGSPVGVEPTVPWPNLLRQNQPNPFNPHTEIAYSVSAPSEVSITIYDLRGQRIRTLVQEFQHTGWHSIDWNGRDDHGQTVASGVYFCRLVIGNFESVRKMSLVK